MAEEKKWWDGDKKLRSTGELVSDGGLSGAVMSILYLIIGVAVGEASVTLVTWSSPLPGWWVGVLIGAVGGLTLVFTHMTRQNKDR